MTNPLIYVAVFVMGLVIFEVSGTNGQLANAQQKKNAKVDKRPSPEEIWKRIKADAQKEVRSNSTLIVVPFSVEKLGSTRHFTIVKDVVRDLEFQGDPYELPFKEQLFIEALRLALSNSTVTSALSAKTVASGKAETQETTDNDWEQYLLSAENLVKQSVVDIETEPDKKILDKKLREIEMQIDDILYGKVYEAVEQAAKDNGYNIIHGRGGNERGKFSVNISTVPDGAKIYVMTDMTYRKQVATNANPSQWPWTEIVQNPYLLLGKYRYRTVWADGKRAEGSIEVLSNSPLKFVPN